MEEFVGSGQAALAEKDLPSALRFAKRALDLDRDAPSAWELLAEVAARNHDNDDALTALEMLHGLRPKSAGKLSLKLGQQWMKENRIRFAKVAIQIAQTEHPELTEPFRWQAQIAGLLGRPREVLRSLIELIKRKAFTRDDLIVVTASNPISSDAQRLKQIVEIDPSIEPDILAYVIHAITLNRLDEAKQRLHIILQDRPHDLEALGLLGELYADEAAPEFVSWQQQLPADADTEPHIWLARGKWLRRQGAIHAAIRCLHEAFLLEPESQSVNFLLAQLLIQADEHQLGAEFTERGKLLQLIISLSSRMNDQRASEWIGPMVSALESTGRLWEARAWQQFRQQSSSRSASPPQMKQLTRDIPRTHPDFLPGKDFDWERFPLPVPEDYLTTGSEGTVASNSSAASSQESAIRFADQAERAGLTFRFVTSGSKSHGRRIYDTMGGGVAVIDYDLDDWPDLYFPQASSAPTNPSGGPSDRIYRNIRGQNYVDVTDSSGIREPSFSQGIAVGDVDCDGFPDVYVGNLGRNRLFKNCGDGTFLDVTPSTGLRQTSWTASCAIADLNGDGFPELIDVNYVQGSMLFTGMCYDKQNRPGVCRPVVYDPATDTVGLNLGDGRFQETQQECGLNLPQGYGLGLVVADFNDDGTLDLFITNDMTPNYLLINELSTADPLPHFRDEAFLRGVALDQNGYPQACMGIAAADLNRDGHLDLFVTNFAREFNTMYLSQSGGYYQDQIRTVGLSEASFEPLGFGTQFLDADHDGWNDLVVGNGHIDEIPNEPYRMRAQFFRGAENGRFTELFADASQGVFAKPRLTRGLALLDWNRDGLVDFVTSDLENAVLLAENQTASAGNHLRLKLIGTTSSRDAIGARIRCRISPTDQRFLQLTTGDGYQSSNQRFLDLGIGPNTVLEEIEILWPSGTRERKTQVAVGSDWKVIEGNPNWISVMSP